ncbi:MAG: hypothetical protein K9H58_17230 [Bacteroidales bacterium]|nr:hypothetical protein [Bacteroidales bacterium]
MRGFLVFISFFISIISFSQIADTIQMKKTNSGIKFYQHKNEIKFVNVVDKVKGNKQANKYINYANTNRIGSYFLTGFAIIGLGYSLAKLAETGDGTYGISGLIVGGSYFLLSIPLRKGYIKNSRKALEIYNSGLSEPSSYNPKIRMGFSSEGVELVYQF